MFPKILSVSFSSCHYAIDKTKIITEDRKTIHENNITKFSWQSATEKQNS